MKKVAGPLKLDLAQYRALAAFAQFAGDLDKATRDQLNRGEKLSEIVKQPQYQPLPVEKQVAILVAATTGKLDDVPTPRVKEFEIAAVPVPRDRAAADPHGPRRVEGADGRDLDGAQRGDRRLPPGLPGVGRGPACRASVRSGAGSARRRTSSRSPGRCSSSRPPSCAGPRSPRWPRAPTARSSTRSSRTSPRCSTARTTRSSRAGTSTPSTTG